MINVLLAILIGLSNATCAGLLKSVIPLPKWIRILLLVPPAAVVYALVLFFYAAACGLRAALRDYLD